MMSGAYARESGKCWAIIEHILTRRMLKTRASAYFFPRCLSPRFHEKKNPVQRKSDIVTDTNRDFDNI